MKYKFAVDKEDYTDFASGRVLYSAPGTTGFPVRLTSEILQRAFAILGTGGHNGPYTIYDPCCGGAFLLTTIGFLFPERIAQRSPLTSTLMYSRLQSRTCPCCLQKA